MLKTKIGFVGDFDESKYDVTVNRNEDDSTVTITHTVTIHLPIISYITGTDVIWN